MLWIIIGMTAVLLVLVVFAYFQRSSNVRIGYVRMRRQALPRIIDALQLAPSTVLYDLGCGDGNILRAALRHQPNIQAFGVEYNPVIALLGRLLGRGRRNYSIVRGDLLTQDLTAATAVFTYLNPETMKLLEPKLASELAVGARLVSCDFPLPTREPDSTVVIGHASELAQKLYIYTF